MASTYSFAPSELGWQHRGNKKAVRGVLTIAGTYATGGDAITLAQLNCGLVAVDNIDFLEGATSIGQVPSYIRATGKIFLRESAVGADPLPEVGNAEASAGTIYVEVIGN